MSTIVDGSAIAKGILSRAKRTIEKQNLRPVLAVILVGSDPASETYVKRKKEAAESIGVKFMLYKFPQSISEDNLVAEMKQIQKQHLSAIIVQMPLPKSLDKKTILNQIDPELDVDFLSWTSLGKLVVGENTFVPPAPGAILEILKYHKVSLQGKHIVLVGQGDLIGKPLTNILIHLPVTITVCNKFTKDLGELTKQADILITGAGKRNLISGSMVKKGVVAIDAGVSFHNDKISGDLNFAEVSKKASIITPTPGGVGPITVAMLLESTVELALKQSQA